MTRIFEGRMPDRPAVKLWAVRPGQKLLHPSYEPIYRLGMEQTEVVSGGGSAFDLHFGRSRSDITQTRRGPTDSDEWENVITEINTPEGTFRSTVRHSTVGKPGYRMEYFLKKPDDLKRLLSFPYEPFPFRADAYHEAESLVGDRGITVFGLQHAMYGLEQIMGSERFALWSLECRDLLLEAMEVFAGRIRDHVTAAFESGLRPIFGFVGPELCIPPLMSPRDFDDFVYRFDKPLIDQIHEGGSRVWVHCHGKMGPVLERFMEMDVDVLNPLEPPPMGDLTLDEAFARVGDQMALEGNVENHDLMTCSRDEVRDIVRQALEAGRGRRHILCTCSGYMEWPYPEERYIENLQTYIEEGVRCAEEIGAG
jgi:hypothetical protein